MATDVSVSLFHSFPRKAKSDQNRALQVLRSMLKSGLLMTPELLTLKTAAGQVAYQIYQQRISFTALNKAELAEHATNFGDFALEYDVNVLRDFGAFPVFYIPAQLRDDGALGGAGNLLADRVAQIERLLLKLVELEKPEATGAEAEAAKLLLPSLAKNHRGVAELRFAAQAVQNLFYPTDNPDRKDLLGYYSQREWKLIPNFALGNQMVVRKPTDAEKKSLLLLDHTFFEAAVNGSQRIDGCVFLESVAGRQVLREATRVVVPAESVKDAAQIIKDEGYSIPVVAA